MIIERYIFREILQAFAGVFIILLLIYISNRFVVTLSDAASGDISSHAIFRVVGLKLVGALSMILPLSFFLSVLIAMGRLYKDSEITAMHAGGIGTRRFVITVLFISLLFSAIAAFISLYAAPKAYGLANEVKEKAEQRADIYGLYAGRFKEFNDGERVFYARHIADDYLTMEDIFVQTRDQQGISTVFAAPAAYQYLDKKTADKFLVLTNGYRYQGNPGDADFVLTHYERQATRIKDSPVEIEEVAMDARTTQELWIAPDTKSIAELQWRMSMPLSLVLFGFLGVLFSRTTPRQGKFARLFIAILFYIIYSNFIGIAKELIAKEEIPVDIGIWPVHAVILVAALIMYFYQVRFKWWLSVYRADRRISKNGETI